MFHFDLSLARERESVFNQRYESVTLYAGPNRPCTATLCSVDGSTRLLMVEQRASVRKAGDSAVTNAQATSRDIDQVEMLIAYAPIDRGCRVTHPFV